ncbi:MAG TPA: hypothetical protein VGF48_12715 [Thermoanaerobaculia bacterium]
MSLTFVVGSAAEVFGGALASLVDAALRERFAVPASDGEAYRSEPIEPAGWARLQHRASEELGGPNVPHLVSIEAYQSVYLPDVTTIASVLIPQAADPLQVGGVDALLSELRALAARASLPTDDVELMQLAAHYLEDDDAFDKDLDVQTYVQLMLSAKQAAARRQPLWVVA